MHFHDIPKAIAYFKKQKNHKKIYSFRNVTILYKNLMFKTTYINSNILPIKNETV